MPTEQITHESGASAGRMSIDEAIVYMRGRPEYAATVRDAYLGDDLADAVARFAASGEWASVRALLDANLSRGCAVNGGTVVDLGAGTGIATAAFLRAGAARVYAIEPDASDLVGRGAVARLCDTSAGGPVTLVDAFGEEIPLADGIADVVYTRQVLHHTQDLPRVLRECARLLKPGGVFLACREHVADNAEQLAAFLSAHPMHQLAGGENAYRLDEYVGAVEQSGLRLLRTLGPWDSVVNAYPAVGSEAELRGYPRRLLASRFGALGALAAGVPGVAGLVWGRLKQPFPGRLYSLLAVKP